MAARPFRNIADVRVDLLFDGAADIHNACDVGMTRVVVLVGDGARLVMPAFGTYAGGLNVRSRAFAHLFGTLSFTAHMLGEGRVYPIAAKRCLRD